MYVIGTAGHVDHGKSTLVKTLTGIDPDRWAEEQRREMTIDLGFAWLTLPSARQVSLIDVPGHERFIKNMLAGVGGIDAALLVIAADESLMPQTAEHLAILDLLDIQHGLVVLSKADMVDADWLALVDEEVAERLRNTSLAHAPRLPVSARTGQGIAELLAALDTLLNTTPSRASAHGAPRLPIDRSFTIGGFGTIVTGTLLDGPLEVGQELVVLPAGRTARVRGLQTHRRNETHALPGTRVAVNLAGIHHREIVRGDVLALPGQLVPTDRVDVRLRLVADAPGPLEQNDRLDLFVGAAETGCHATILERNNLAPGESGWVQLRLDQPIAVARGDRCIVRQASPSLTIGGGSIMDAHPPRHRRFHPEVVTGLELLARGTPADLLLQALGDGPPQEWESLLRTSNLPPAVAFEALAELAQAGTLLVLGSPPLAWSAGLLVSQAPGMVVLNAVVWPKLAERLMAAVQGYHRRYPLRQGIPREELRQRQRLPGRVADAVVDEGRKRAMLAQNATVVWLAAFTPTPTAEQQRIANAFVKACQLTPFSPPVPELEPELLAWLIEQGVLVRVAEDIYFLEETYAELIAWVRSTIQQQGAVTVGQLRDHFSTSRKYGLALLEHLDQLKITRREGEGRVLV